MAAEFELALQPQWSQSGANFSVPTELPPGVQQHASCASPYEEMC